MPGGSILTRDGVSHLAQKGTAENVNWKKKKSSQILM